MSGHATSLAEWMHALSLGVTAGALLPLVLAFADCDLAYFDPRRVLDTRPGAAAREFGRDAAALLILLCTSPKGAMAA